MMNEIINKMTPKAIASSKRPMFVCIMIAVVMTRVLNWMLPPTICTAPTSAMDRPKPANALVTKGIRHSFIVNQRRFEPEIPIPAHVSLIDGARKLTMLAVIPAMIGEINTTCAMTIAETE